MLKEVLEHIELETKLIATLEANPVKPEYYEGYNYPKGDYAVYVTEIKDAYWRRRNLYMKRDQLTGLE
jgi:hypothetical protein